MASTTWALLFVASISVGSTAAARPYTVFTCDAAVGSAFSSSAWRPTASVGGSAYASCPSQGDQNRGISNRITGISVPALSYSAHTFTAPPATSITSLRWGGRFARNDCRWGAFVQALPSMNVVFGLRPNDGCLVSNFDITGQTIPWTVPPGTTSLQQIVICGAASCGPGAAFHTHYAAVTLDDPTRPVVSASGPLVAGRWVSGNQQIVVTSRDNTGISSHSATLGPATSHSSFSCNYALARPCLDRSESAILPTVRVPSGLDEVVLTAIDASGNLSIARYPVHVDNEPPTRVRPALDGGEAWRRSNGFVVRWQNPVQAHAPIVRARYRLCAGTECSDGQVDGRDIQTLGRLLVPESGEHTLQVWLEDEAGNHSYTLSASDPLHLRLDQEAPTLAFEPQNAADPLRVAVQVSDRHSGVDGGEIEMRRRGGNSWQTLATAREGERLVSYVDDERFRSGSYEFRARARDRAGNERTTDRRADGARATIDLPARFATRLSVGFRQVIRHGKHRRVRLAPRASAPHSTRIKLLGRLTNADGQPIDGATVDVSSDSPGDSVGLLPVGIAQTDREGRFSYVVTATRNKVLRFRYSGSRRIRGATGDFELRVPAASSLRARPRRLRNGQSVRLSGVVQTRPLPPAGKLIEVQAFFRGRFRTFSTTRADNDGRWRFDYRFGGTRGRVIYRLRVLLPAEGGYPFVTGRSRVARVVVIGP